MLDAAAVHQCNFGNMCINRGEVMFLFSHCIENMSENLIILVEYSQFVK